jgi:hypothetical protein
VWATSAALSWEPNPEGDLAGYKIYYGTGSLAYTNTIVLGMTSTPSTPTYTVTNLEEGKTYYFALTAYDTSGYESSFSEEVQKSVSQDQTVNPLQDQADNSMGGSFGCGMIRHMSGPGTPPKWSLDLILIVALLLGLSLKNNKSLKFPQLIRCLGSTISEFKQAVFEILLTEQQSYHPLVTRYFDFLPK